MTQNTEIQVGEASQNQSEEHPCVNAGKYLSDWYQNTTEDFCDNLKVVAKENRAFVIKEIIPRNTGPLWFQYVHCLFKPNEEEQTQPKIFLTEKKWGVHKLYDLIDFVCYQVSNLSR